MVEQATEKMQTAFLQQQSIQMLIGGQWVEAASGYGREMGHAVLDAYTQVKTAWINLR